MPDFPSEQDDVIRGTDQADTVDSLAGNDVVEGLAGDDVLSGGAGDDWLYGDAGNDLLYGGAGNDIIYVGEGTGIAYGGDGNDMLIGSGNVANRFYGGRGNDIFSGIGIKVIDARLSEIVIDFSRDTPANAGVHDPESQATWFTPITFIASPDGKDYGVSLGTVELQDATFGLSFTSYVTRSVYEAFMGRKPTTADYLFWETQNVYANERRDAILDSAEGRAAFAATVNRSYQELTGRTATASEIDHWRDVYTGPGYFEGLGYGPLRGGIMDENPAASAQVIDAQYQMFFGRAATGAEIGRWKKLFRDTNGPVDTTGLSQYYANVGTLTDALMTDAGSRGTVLQLTGTAAADVFTLPAGFTNVHIMNFDPVLDRISFAGTAFATVDPRDPALAEQVFDVLSNHFEDGTMSQGGDVLVTLDATHHILIEGTGADSRAAGLDREQYLSGTTNEVDDYYMQYFNRTAYRTEITTWNRLFSEGATYETLVTELLASSEHVLI